MKALFTYDYGEKKMQSIKNLGYEIIFRKERDLVYDEELEDVEALICYSPFSTLDIGKMKNLKWIQLSSIGIDQVPLEKVKDQGILLTNNKGGYSIPMGEFIVMKILELFKNSKTFYHQQQQKQWKMDTSLIELYNKRVSFIGTGSIAVEGAKRLQGFGVEITGVNTRGRDVEYFHKCYPIKDLYEVLKHSDVVVLTIPYTDETHHLIDDGALAAMNPKAYLINVSRGSVVEEPALIEHLKQESIQGAALDVVEEEPLREDSPLWDFANVIITPHNSWVSEMRNQRRFDTIYENAEKFSRGETLKNLVNLDKGY
ncbi:phosphoglycerate dehydrogenase [Isachenkonia alkalipeptolytica]|uniref:Dihydrofolate reductase n=1 Tax=Isachenkonia alkalipeptolytica TaxID=2565777 RepID=A0AA44BC55_9CLOT|nr:phosphoglycerate dehydrogenase [Isachenkonia alkalipeptolytica]NBG87029.1 dihydrofolate reductase [Isachenkonia alkalipeptolytica]